MTRATSRSFNTALAELGQAAGVPIPDCKMRAQDLSIDSRFRAAEGAAAALAAGAGIANEIALARGHEPGTVRLASRHVEASLLSFAHLRFKDPQAAPASRLEPESRTAVAGFFATAGGADGDCLVGIAHVKRARVGLGIDRDRANTEPSAGADHAPGDLAPVGDKKASKHGGRYIRKMPNVVFSIGALSAAEIDRPSTVRVSAGSMMPSSHSRAEA